MSFLEYPKYKYHASKNAIVVNNAAEEIALGDDWYNSQFEANNPPAIIVAQEEIVEEKAPKKKTSKK